MNRYRISNSHESLEFRSGKEGAKYLGVAECTFTAACKNGHKCRGYVIEQLSDGFHGETNTDLYRIWRHMRDRCEKPNTQRYERYGGRGISVCDEWSEYKPFAKWARENGYTKGLSIDRINNDDGYYPGNCRWATFKEQNNNRSGCRYITLDGETHTIAEWSDITGMRHSTITQRLNQGWSDEDVLTRPLRPHVRKNKKSAV